MAVEKQTFTFEAWPVGTVLYTPQRHNREGAWRVGEMVIQDFRYYAGKVEYFYLRIMNEQEREDTRWDEECFPTHAEAQAECDRRNTKGGGK